MEWLRAAACVGEDPDLFFPVSTIGPALREAAAAKRVCARCPVSSECLSYALGTAQTSGVWGGTGEEERVELLRTAGYDATRRRRGRTEPGRARPLPASGAGWAADG
ncbi:WhiB family transcriptional regulator [Streptomyces sp. NPDC002566]|uniref:WhiB family transcriptional regulator n=1 Tax=Streptomyces sp. NPDC002566 TaxID=3364650 RepID=UPI0036BD50FC